ncbi:50S ribosomal protein L25 [Blattabacterium cuenoti]|uniref:50S ribosomal protein L25 n=1 Tax=Blattabacterium cuenoti TaxID=1653831 RepID=UPI00163C1020|nr:50S ribosomal protein L25 [Blattabacterium cuenoti]
MKYINIYGEERNTKNRNYINFIRKSKKIPCILYGKNINIPFSTSLEVLKDIILNTDIFGIILTLKGIDKPIKAIKKEVQYDPVKDNILHVDFYKIDKLTPIILNIPIKFSGIPIGVSKGGEYYSPIKNLKIKALPYNIPEFININIDSLDIGDKMNVKEIKNDKFIILNPDNTLIIRIKDTRTSRVNKEE